MSAPKRAWEVARASYLRFLLALGHQIVDAGPGLALALQARGLARLLDLALPGALHEPVVVERHRAVLHPLWAVQERLLDRDQLSATHKQVHAVSDVWAVTAFCTRVCMCCARALTMVSVARGGCPRHVRTLKWSEGLPTRQRRLGIHVVDDG